MATETTRISRTVSPSRRTLFTLLAVPWTADSRAILFILPKLLIGCMVAAVFTPGNTFMATILTGLVYGVLLNVILLLHILGHILSSKLAQPAMTEARITPLMIQTRYDDDPPSLSAQVHLLRAVGGPVMNLVTGTLALLVWLSVGGQYLLFFALANKIIGVMVLLPLPTVDGAVIWRELPRLLHPA